MKATTDPGVVPARPATGPRQPKMLHAVCTRCLRINVANMRARCGTPISDEDRLALRAGKTPEPGRSDKCVVCLDLVAHRAPCERCGLR